MQKYVLGFIFDDEEKNVLLIQKQRPLWQKGLFNGIGGKVENFDDNHFLAIQREVFEETNLTITNWKYFAKLTDQQFFDIDCFKTNLSKEQLKNYQTMTDEDVQIKSIESLYKTKFNDCISNLSWLIGICLDRDSFKMFHNIIYRNEK